MTSTGPTLEQPRDPWRVAKDLQWRVARDVLLDPITWLGVLVAGWALRRTGVLGAEGALLALMALAVVQGDELLFRRQRNDLLRVMPLGPGGFLRVCRDELGWWTHPGRLLAAAAASSDGGWLVALLVWLAGSTAPLLGLRLAIALRATFGQRGAFLAWLPLPLVFFIPLPFTWEAAVVFGAVGLLAGLDLPRAYARRHAQLASDARTSGGAGRGAAFALLSRIVVLPPPLRARLVRDALLLLRGRDVQGAILLLLSPLSCLVLLDEIASMPSRAALPWRVLTAAALGGAAVAWATGPGIHRLRARTMAWERTAPRPGRWATWSALLLALAAGLLHGGATLATAALAQDGRFAADVPGLILPVLGLEAAMAHYVALFCMGATRGRSVAGEGTIVLALPVVAIAVALVAIFFPPGVLLYFVVTAPMVASGIQRYERVEVTW